MPGFESYNAGSGSSGKLESSTQQFIRKGREKRGVVFSANGDYNPTSLAVQNSLKDIFDEFHVMVTGRLKSFNEEDDE